MINTSIRQNKRTVEYYAFTIVFREYLSSSDNLLVAFQSSGQNGIHDPDFFFLVYMRVKNI